MNELRNTLAASRPVSWINTAFPFAVGWLLHAPVSWPFIIGTFFFLIPYNIAMYGINDIFDYESDIRNPRKASVEGAQLSKKDLQRLWKYILGSTIPFVIYLILTGSVISTIFLFISLFMVVAYSAVHMRFKEIPFLDSITSSTHFVSPFVFGIAYAGGTISTFWPAIAAFFMWGMASHAFGAIQDIVYDREGGIASIATVLGARFTLWFSIIAYSAAIALTLWQYPGPAAWHVAVALALYISNCLRYVHISDATAHTTNPGWRMFMALNMGTGALLTTGGLYLFVPAFHSFWYVPALSSIVVLVASIMLLVRPAHHTKS
jgi:4-hydroxybenzoate polyprenyltransferase